MWKTLARLVFILLFLFVVLSSALVYYVYSHQDEIEQRLISQLNESLETEVEVHGNLNLSVISYFPNISLQVNNIIIKGSTGQPTDTLIAAGSLYLITSIYDLIDGNWRIQEVEITDGSLHMTRSAQGVVNYQFVKSTGESTGSNPFLLNIEGAALKNIHFLMEDELAKVYLDIQVYDATFSGNFSSDALALDADINTLANNVTIKDINYVQQKHIAAEGTLSIDTDNSIYDIRSDEAVIANNRFALAGTFGVQDNKTDLNLTIAGKELVLTELLKLFPCKVSSQFEEYKATGELEFTTTIVGELSRDQNPQIDITYQLRDGSIHYTKLGADVERLNVAGTYTNGKKHNLATSVINLTQLQVTHEGRTLNATANISNLNKPLLDITASGEINLHVLQPLLSDTADAVQLSGLVKISTSSYKGTVEQLMMTDSYKPIELHFEGTFENALVQMKDEAYGLKSGHLIISPWTITAEDLQLALDNNLLTLNGTAKYWKSYYYNLTAKQPQSVQALTLDMQLKADELLFASNAEPASTGTKKQWPIAERVFDLAGNLRVDIDRLQYDKLDIQQLHLDLGLGKKSVNIKDASLNTMGGNVKATGTLVASGNGITYRAAGRAQKIDISRTFKELDNFGQTNLTHDNIKGVLTATFTTNGRLWNYTFLPDAFELNTQLTLESGELVNFAALENLSGFIKLEELKHIKFNSLRNTLEIKKQTITIPQMIIKSSALNLSIAGTHTFDNIVDYKIKVNAYDILANKIRKNGRSDQFYEVVDDNSFNFFISMKGPLTNPTISYDKQGVKERFKEQGKQVKKALQGIYDYYNADKERRDWEIPNEDQFLDWENEIP